MLWQKLAEPLRRAPGFKVAELGSNATIEERLARNGQRALLVVFVISESQPSSSKTEARLCLLPGEQLLGDVPIRLEVDGPPGLPMELLEMAAEKSGEKIVDHLEVLLETAREADKPGNKRNSCRSTEEHDAGQLASFPRSRSSQPSGPCTGDSLEVRRLLAEHAAESRTCYERALRKDPQLTARVRVGVRVDAEGNAWAHISDELEHAEMKECIVQLFQRRLAAAPDGGCMDAIVPLNFVAKRKAR